MKFISTPLGPDAMRRLDTNECLEGDLFEIELSDEAFRAMDDRGIFDAINTATGAMIDEFESEHTTNLHSLQRGREAVEGFGNVPVVAQIAKAFDSAIERETGVFFFL